MKTFEDTQCRRSIVTDTLQSLTEQAKAWRTKIDQLEAGQSLDRAEAVSSLNQLLDVGQNLRDAIFSEDSAANWRTKEELHTLVDRLDDAAAKRRRYLDLAQVLATGTVVHRRERTRLDRLKQRDAAVAELMEISALPSPPELPGPAGEEWLNWACNLDDSTNDPDLLTLKNSFPRVDDFVRQLEIETWQHAPSPHGEQPAQAALPVSTGPETVAAISMIAESEKVEAPPVETHASSSNGTSFLTSEAHSSETVEEPSVFWASEELPTAELSSTELPVAEPQELPDVTLETPIAPANEKMCFFPAEEIDAFVRTLAEAKHPAKGKMRARSLLAISHWLVPRDQNPVLQAKCGIRTQIQYAGAPDLGVSTVGELEAAVATAEGLRLFAGGADLLRWSLRQRSAKRFDEIATVRRLSSEQLRTWFGEVYKIELAEPQVVDMYKLTFGIPLLVGELHRRVIPIHDAPPTWLGYAIWTRIKMSYESSIPSLAHELRNGSPAVRLTEREIALLKMMVIASFDSSTSTIAANLGEDWARYNHPELAAMTDEDEDSIAVLQRLGLVPMRSEFGMKPLHAILPIDQDDPIRQIVRHL